MNTADLVFKTRVLRTESYNQGYGVALRSFLNPSPLAAANLWRSAPSAASASALALARHGASHGSSHAFGESTGDAPRPRSRAALAGLLFAAPFEVRSEGQGQEPRAPSSPQREHRQRPLSGRPLSGLPPSGRPCSGRPQADRSGSLGSASVCGSPGGAGNGVGFVAGVGDAAEDSANISVVGAGVATGHARTRGCAARENAARLVASGGRRGAPRYAQRRRPFLSPDLALELADGDPELLSFSEEPEDPRVAVPAHRIGDDMPEVVGILAAFAAAARRAPGGMAPSRGVGGVGTAGQRAKTTPQRQAAPLSLAAQRLQPQSAERSPLGGDVYQHILSGGSGESNEGIASMTSVSAWLYTEAECSDEDGGDSFCPE